MDDKYLDNVFREKLELTQQHDFDENAWLDLESRLEDKPNRRIAWWRWAAAAGILLPMLLSSLYFYHQLKETERQLAKLETKMNRFLKKDASKIVAKEEEANLATTENGTSRQNTQPNITTQTASATLSLTPSIITKSSNTKVNNVSISETNQFSPLANNHTAKMVIAAEVKSNSATDETIEPTQNIVKSQRSNPSFLANNNAAYTKAFPVPKTETVNYENLVKKERTLIVKENTLADVKEQFKPIGFEIGTGFQSGMVLSQTLSSKPFFRNESVKVAVNFISGTDLTLGANYAVYTYETKTIEQDFPTTEPKSPDDLFQQVIVSESVIQIPVGLKYNFGYYDDVFAPFVEIGGIAKKSIQKTHKFDYNSPTRPEEPYAIRPKPQKINEGFAMNTVSGSVGVKWNPNVPKSPILDNVIVQAELFGNADFEKSDTQWMAGIGVSASYMF